jgi:uncharacterized protein
VHQDGLVHVSQLAHRFVNDAREIVKAGDIVKVRVLEVDLPRKRIALTLKLDARPAPKGEHTDNAHKNAHKAAYRGERPALRAAATAAAGQEGGSAMAEAFARLRSGR